MPGVAEGPSPLWSSQFSLARCLFSMQGFSFPQQSSPSVAALALHSTQCPARTKCLQLTVSTAFGCTELYYPHSSHNCLRALQADSRYPLEAPSNNHTALRCRNAGGEELLPTAPAQQSQSYSNQKIVLSHTGVMGDCVGKWRCRSSRASSLHVSRRAPQSHACKGPRPLSSFP